MIQTPTVFVLGAGASVRYLYPSGRELIGNIFNLANHEGFNKFLEEAYPGAKAAENFKLLAESLWSSPVPSIDQFLEHHPEFLELGKFAIAFYFNSIHETHLKDRVNYNRDWYLTLFQEYLYERDFSAFINNQIKFVTFNYDISLEMFFHRAIGSMFPMTQGKITDFFKNIEIIHIHGKIRKWSWEDNPGPGIAETDLTVSDIKNISKNNIYLIHEDESFGPETILARDIIETAERIVFLGSGFHMRNMDKLQMDWDSRKRMFDATAVNLTTAMRNVINKRCLNKLEFYGWDCNEYLLNKMDILNS